METDIEVCHRVPTRNADATPNIIVQFKSRTKRDSILEKAKKSRLSTQELGFSPGSPLYVNEPNAEASSRHGACAKESEKLAICLVK